MRRYRRRSGSQYLLPFVVLISLGVFLMLAFQLWGSFFPTAKGDAVFYLAEGRSKLLGFGMNEWENAYNGSRVKLGDSVKTMQNARGVMSFYDGTVLRMDENTQITLVDISKKSDYQEILIYLNAGKIWVNKPKQNVIRKTDFVINTDYATYAITGTIFDLEKAEEEILHVVRGQVEVGVVENVDGRMRTLETIPVGIGQQVVLNERVMQEYYQRREPSVLGVLDPLFQTSDWYVWNDKEDENPTDFASGRSVVAVDDVAPGEVVSADTEAPVVTSSLAAPVLVTPKSTNIVSAKDSQVFSGKVAAGTQKLLLKQLLAGEDSAEKILVNALDEEALTWSYSVSAQKGNLKPGKNVYEFVGVDENARETASLVLSVEYQPEEADLANDLPAISKPVVLTVGDKPYREGMVIDQDAFVMAGKVSGAGQMWVDDFQLTKFKSGDTTWSYNVKTAYGNLKAGLNSYQVYGVGADGKKSPILTVKINYKPAVVAPAATTVTTGGTSEAGGATSNSSVTTTTVPVPSAAPVVAAPAPTPVVEPEKVLTR